MADMSFPTVPVPPALAPPASALVERRGPLVSIREVLAISIHDAINDPRWKSVVRDLYKISRRIRNEEWLRREIRRIG